MELLNGCLPFLHDKFYELLLDIRLAIWLYNMLAVVFLANSKLFKIVFAAKGQLLCELPPVNKGGGVFDSPPLACS
ncbi:hypothetical protein Lpp126_14985 [Lacticaseibacillus paracasei subsp. paracasei Lpp126]|uniref:Uncharacterized protein n=1 Tax=Lacticaseibacillus paracasei subsp. paracasei Lpp126 TaxID=1256206 RepID=S2RWI4_LACPA|nr:hypothetical protein Lpp126_14985 [Lacticaseibacillus paracasei subsp. paracasei Lpp126]